MRIKLGLIICSLALLACIPLAAQTFEVTPQGGAQAGPAPAPQRKGQASKGASSQPGLAWGASIEVARQARAADTALRRGDYTGAYTFAERAAKAAPQDMSLQLMWGYAARASGRLQVALSVYNHILQVTPSSIDALSGLAQTYLRMGRSDEAKRLLMQVLAQNPRRSNELEMAGELFLQTGDYNRALPLLQRAQGLTPTARGDLLIAVAYQHLKQPELARQYLQRALARDPRNPQVLRAVAGYYRDAKDYAASIAALRKVPRTPDAVAEIGYTYELWGKRKQAAENYAAAANAAPQQLNYQLSAASSEMAVQDYAAAQRFVDRAGALNPGYYRVHAIRAELERHENHSEQAIREYNLALSSLPESPPEGLLYPFELRMSLADLYKTSGNEEAARQQYQTAWSQMSQMDVQGDLRSEFLRLRGSTRAALGDGAGALADLKEAASLDPDKPDILLQYGSVLWKVGQKTEARRQYERVLALDSKNEWALTALGYLARDMGDTKAAENYFHKLAAAYPNSYVPWLALGDMYTAIQRFPEGEAAYEKAYKLNPTSPLIVAGGANTGIEWHHFELSKKWLDRASAEMNRNPYVMRERERYLTWVGKYAESATVAQQVIKMLPKDRDVVVYYGYDLLNLGRYDDLLELTGRYEKVFAKDRDLPLLAGYVHKNSGLLQEAGEDFTRAIENSPKTTTAYTNRGYVYNDTQNAEGASSDFESALKLDANNGSAQLGLAFAQLELHHAKAALDHAQLAHKLLGESAAVYDALATGYRQQGLLKNAEKDYRAALKYSPEDLKLRLGLADTLYHERRYNDAIAALRDALHLSPDDPFIYAQMAHAYAQLKQRPDTMRYIEVAERLGADQSDVLLATGDALLVLGDHDAAMGRFLRALDAPDSDRVQARLAIAKVMINDGKWDDAHEQIGLAFAESRIGEASPITAEHLLEAADMFLRMHDFDLAINLFERARAAGAADPVVAIGLANVYLERGDTLDAQTQMASLGNPADYQENYDYLLTQASLYRQQHQDVRALTAFAQANQIAGQSDVAERELTEMAGQEGVQLNDKVSVLTDFSMTPIFEDSTVYQMDARMFNASGKLLPPPRSSLQTQWLSGFRVHQPGLPLISGFVGLRNAAGELSLPAEGVIVNRNTFDYMVNGALNPVLRLGRNSFTFNTGLQFTLRRDHNTPVDMNQNLFRQFVYVSSNALGNWLTIHGEAIHESGPFTLRDLHSRELVGRLEFEVGRPWGHTSLVTGYMADDLLFRPLVREWFTTSSYVGLERRWGRRLRVRGLAEYIRGWRVQDLQFVIAQSMRPAAEVHFMPTKQWSIDGNLAWSRGMGMHDYDNMTSGLFVTYTRRWRRAMDDGSGQVPVDYPVRFSAGFEQDDFYNFTGNGQPRIFRPVIRLTIF